MSNTWNLEEENLISFEIIADFGELIGSCVVNKYMSLNTAEKFFEEFVNGQSNTANQFACDIQKAETLSLVVRTYNSAKEVVSEALLQRCSNISKIQKEIENLYCELLKGSIDYIFFGFSYDNGRHVPSIAQVLTVTTNDTPASSIVKVKGFSDFNKTEISVMYIYQHAQKFMKTVDIK